MASSRALPIVGPYVPALPTMDLTAGDARWTLGQSLHPSPATSIHRAIRRTLDAYRQSSYEAFAFDMQIIPVEPRHFDPDSFDTRNPQNTSGLGYTGNQSFLFKPLGDDEPRKVVARMHPVDNETVEVSLCRTPPRKGRTEFRPLISYLKALPIKFSPNRTYAMSSHSVSVIRTNHQQDLWAANGKSFPFLNLPQELREMVYRHCVGSVIEPYPSSPRRKRKGLPVEKVVELSHLQINKEISKEILRMIYSFTSFYIVDSTLLSRMLSWHWFPKERLKRLTLALSHRHFFRFFGLTIEDISELDSDDTDDDSQNDFDDVASQDWEYDDDDDGIEPEFYPSRARPLFQQLKLQSLELRMPHPSSTCDVSLLDDGCQKKAVDLILEAAWPYVKGQPITVTGYVKKSQKRAYESMAKKAIREKDRMESLGLIWDGETEDETDKDVGGGVMLDGSGAVKGELSMLAMATEKGQREHVVEVVLPLVCECETSCLEDWSPEG